LLKLFQGAPGDDDPETRLSQAPEGEDLESEFRTIILDELARGGIPPRCLTIDIRTIGHARDGRLVYQGNLRVASWEPAVVRLLLGLPLLQSKVRRVVRSSWLNDVCHFHGLWLHPSGQLEEPRTMGQLRDVIVRVEAMMREKPLEHSAESPHQSVWSVPPELDSSDPDHSGHVPL
jgi:hypothetical protein